MKVLRLTSLTVALFTFVPAAALANDVGAPAPASHLGWSQTQIAGKAPGEIGGTVSTAATPAFYADKIEPKTLKDELKASGVICLPKQPATKTAVFVGWFNSGLKGWQIGRAHV